MPKVVVLQFLNFVHVCETKNTQICVFAVCVKRQICLTHFCLRFHKNGAGHLFLKNILGGLNLISGWLREGSEVTGLLACSNYIYCFH